MYFYLVAIYLLNKISIAFVYELVNVNKKYDKL